MDASYQTLPACSQAKPPSAVANRKKAWFGMPELMCTPPLSSEVSTKSSMCAGCGSLPSTGSSYAVPGAFIERRATPLMSGPRMPAPISQSASSAVCCGEAARCLTREPKTSESDSLRAPDWFWYDEIRLVRGDRVGQLVGHHVDGTGEAGEQDAVAVTEDHLRTVPERVVVVPVEMDRARQGRARIVVRVASVDVEVEIPGRTEPVVHPVRFDVPGRRVGLPPGRSDRAGSGCSPRRGSNGACSAAPRVPPWVPGARAAPRRSFSAPAAPRRARASPEPLRVGLRSRSARPRRACAAERCTAAGRDACS